MQFQNAKPVGPKVIFVRAGVCALVMVVGHLYSRMGDRRTKIYEACHIPGHLQFDLGGKKLVGKRYE